jgi:hypothetical protein
LGRSETISLAKTAVPQALLERFPMRINRENIAKIRDLIGGNREL